MNIPIQVYLVRKQHLLLGPSPSGTASSLCSLSGVGFLEGFSACGHHQCSRPQCSVFPAHCMDLTGFTDDLAVHRRCHSIIVKIYREEIGKYYSCRRAGGIETLPMD